MNKKTYEFYKKLGRACFKKPTVYLPKDFDENGPNIFLSNHSKNYGPVITVTRFPVEFRPWCHSGVVHLDESYDYIRDGFFVERLKLCKGVAGFFSRMIAKPLTEMVNMNDPITAYHDISKSLTSINMGVEAIENGENQLMFANVPLVVDGQINPNFDFMKGYLIVVKKAIRLGIVPKIYPVSLNKQKATMSIGEPAIPNLHTDWNVEKQRIHSYLVREVIAGYDDPQRLRQDTDAIEYKMSANF